MVYFAPVTYKGKGTCICFNCVKSRGWLTPDGDLKPDIEL